MPFVLPVSEGYVIKVCDGDSITIAFRLSSSDGVIYRHAVRVRGIDCPEMHPRKKASPEKTAEIECANLAKQRVTTSWALFSRSSVLENN